jgi:hypothetical protein
MKNSGGEGTKVIFWTDKNGVKILFLYPLSLPKCHHQVTTIFIIFQKFCQAFFGGIYMRLI